MNKNSRATILVSGMLARVPYHGGATWAVLQYVLGLRRLGHDVFFVERLAQDALLPGGASLMDSTNARYFCEVVQEFGLEQRAALYADETHEIIGMTYGQLRALAARADMLINLSGLFDDAALVEKIPARVYVDLDPAFTQLWHAAQNIDMHFDAHTHFVTVGRAIGNAECVVPTCGREWIPTLQPIVLEHWNTPQPIRYDAFTTVANWRGYGSIDCDGIFYGQKVHSWRAFMDLPQRAKQRFMPALAIHPDEKKDVDALRAHGWQLLNPNLANTPSRYRAFVQQSKAELGIAKSGYVASRCGWFSDRSICYLAAGRPVLAQETGFSSYVPTGEGLFAFETMEDVLKGIELVNGAYARHARAAREIARAHFDSDTVLRALLEKIGI